MMLKNNIGLNTNTNYGSGAEFRGTTKGNGKGGSVSGYTEWGGGYGDGNDYSYGSINGQGKGTGFENNRCTRLLANDYPDINFYISQIQLLKGRSL